MSFRVLTLLLTLTGANAALPPPAAAQTALAAGVSAQQTAELDGTPFQVFTYRPAGCQPSAILLVFHGVDRNASGYRDDAIPLAQRYCMVVAAPLFDVARFPSWSYQRGGIVQHGLMQPQASWTIRYVPLLADWVRQQEHRPDLPYDQIGHSAGAQFLSRVVAFGTGSARHTILANPSTWVRPSLAVAAPYGFGGAPDAEAALKRSLAAQVTLLLGQDDVGSKNLATSEEAEDQGATRFERGTHEFQEAQDAARQHGWPLNWQMSVVPSVGHNARRMFASDQAFAALNP